MPILRVVLIVVCLSFMSIAGRNGHAASSDAALFEIAVYFLITTFSPTTTTVELINAPSARSAKARELEFVQRNYAALSENVAQGGGEALASFYGLLECTDPASEEIKKFNAELQSNLIIVVPLVDDVALLRANIKKRMRDVRVGGRYVFRDECKWLSNDIDTNGFIKN